MPTQSTDIMASPYGIAYTANSQTWKILKGVDVVGDDAGVYSMFVNSKLVNSGSIFGEIGVLFDAGGGMSDYVVKNQKKADIGGEYGFAAVDFIGSAFIKNKGDIDALEVGVYAGSFDGSVKLLNKGSVDGGTAGFYTQGSSDVSVENHGEISGGQAGVAVQVNIAGAKAPMIENHGSIDGFQAGIYILGTTGVQAKVVNHKGAEIDGAQFGILSQESLKLKNKGKIDGTVVTADYQDKIVNKGKIKDDVSLGGADDVFKSKGKKAKAGLIDTGEGNDTVVFGKKADKLLFDSALNAATNVDTVKKFESGKDKVYLDVDFFSTITPGTLTKAEFHKGTSATDADDRIIYDKASGALYYDPDGVGGIAQTQFATFDPGTKLKASDFTIGEYSIPLP